MKKLLTGLRYGNWYTRLYILAIPICIAGGVGLMATSFLINSMLMFLSGVGIGIIGLILCMRFDIQEITYVPNEKKGKKQAAKKADYTKLEKKQEKEEAGEPKTEKEAELLAYDEKKIKQIFYRYKVRAEHRIIMIDKWEQESVHQSPAYIWKQHRQFRILVLGDGVQEYSISWAKLAVMKYHRGIICHVKQEYPQFRKESLMKQVFSPCLPVYHEGTKNGKPVIYKNLFELGDGLFVTNTSGKAIMELAQPELVIEDQWIWNAGYNIFFKEIYKQGILFREQVISPTEYRNRITGYLENLAESAVPDDEYRKNLQALYENRLISQEYVTYYQTNRDKLRLEEQRGEKRTRKKNRKKGRS